MADGDLSVMAVIMARQPTPGQIKTRLVADGWCDEEQAARIAISMMRCTISRIARAFGGENTVLAITPDRADGREFIEKEHAVRCVAQGPGDLGQRLVRIRLNVDPHRPIAFFGIDSPDVPIDELQRLRDFFKSDSTADSLWIGPAEDGGFWTIAGRPLTHELFANIDWGTGAVYDQVCANAAASGLRITVGRAWPDVDHGRDVGALMRRLETSSRADTALGALLRELTLITGRVRT